MVLCKLLINQSSLIIKIVFILFLILQVQSPSQCFVQVALVQLLSLLSLLRYFAVVADELELEKEVLGLHYR